MFSPFSIPQTPNYIYADLQMTNLESNSVNAKSAFFNQNRSSAILANVGDYEMTISRFSVNTKGALPTFQPQIQLNSTDPNLTIYSVTFSYGGQTLQTYLEWSPEDMSQTVPTAPSVNTGGVQANTPYYYALSYGWLPYLVQNTLNTAFAAFQAQCTTALIVLPTNSAGDTPTPTIVFDSATGVSSLYMDVSCFDQTSSDDVIQMYFNSSMASLFSFPYIKYGSSNLGMNYLVVVKNPGGVNTTTIPTTSDNPYTVVIVAEEYSSLAQQNPVVSLAFVSSIPIVSTAVYPAVIMDNGSQVNNYSQASNVVEPIISDFVVGNGVWLPFIVYEPTVLRWITLTGHGPLTDISISVLWKNKVGLFTPMILSSGSCVTLKLLFRRLGV